MITFDIGVNEFHNYQYEKQQVKSTEIAIREKSSSGQLLYDLQKHDESMANDVVTVATIGMGSLVWQNNVTMISLLRIVLIICWTLVKIFGK